MQAITSVVLLVFLALLTPGTSSYAQQTTGQLLISSGSNPIAARPFFVYADPSGCTSAYVGSNKANTT